VLPVRDPQSTSHDIEELEATMLVEVGVGAFAGLELGEVGIELAVGNEIAEALEEVVRILCSGLRESHAVLDAMDAEDGLRSGIEEVVEVLAEDHRDLREVTQCGNDATGLELGEEAGREATVATEFDQPHGGPLTQSADPLTDALFLDEGFDCIATDLNVGRYASGRIDILGSGQRRRDQSG